MDPSIQNPVVPNQAPVQGNSIPAEQTNLVTQPTVNNSVPLVAQSPTIQSASQVTQTVSTSGVVNIVYANFGRRFLAIVIDLLILEVVSFLVSLLLGRTSSNGFSLTGAPAYAVYFLYIVFNVLLTAKFGKTIGKMAMKIKVVDINTNNIPSVGSLILREVIGKFLSSITLTLGYLWMLWDSRKQTWHDKIAKTIVIKA